MKYLKSIRFSKKVVVSCIVIIAVYTVVQSYLSHKIGMELTPTLTTCVYTFFGTELAACALIRIFDKEDKSTEESEEQRLVE